MGVVDAADATRQDLAVMNGIPRRPNGKRITLSVELLACFLMVAFSADEMLELDGIVVTDRK
jgi:hypothetical protein